MYNTEENTSIPEFNFEDIINKIQDSPTTLKLRECKLRDDLIRQNISMCLLLLGAANPSGEGFNKRADPVITIDQYRDSIQDKIMSYLTQLTNYGKLEYS